MKHTQIAPRLIANYRIANYKACIETRTLILHIDRHSRTLNQLFLTTKRSCAVFITACNPQSQQHNIEENLHRNKSLRTALTQHTDLIFEGESTDPNQSWSTEQSFFGLGVNLETAKTLGRRFGQTAIVWADADAIPRLILLR